jgi:hypothetical protein
MKSCTESLGLLQSLSKVQPADTTNSTLLVQLWNDSIRTIASMRSGKWPWLETTVSVPTVSSQAYVEIPNNIRKLVSLYIQNSGGTIYPVTPIFDRGTWERVLATRLAASDVPLFVYVQGTRVYIQPTPATTANTVYMTGRINLRDLSVADYTTGGILTLANGGTGVTGTGTTWTTSMAGRWLRIAESDTANKGDGFWYPITSVGSATTITLGKPYNGTAISAGNAAYIIGQMNPIPEAYDMAPIYRAVALITQINSPLQPAASAQWWKLYDGGYEAGLRDTVGGLIGQMLEEATATIEGSYIPPGAVSIIDPNVPPTNLSGF